MRLDGAKMLCERKTFLPQEAIEVWSALPSAPLVQHMVFVIHGHAGTLQLSKRCDNALVREVTRRIVFSAYDQDSEVMPWAS